MTAWLTDFIKRLHDEFGHLKDPTSGPAIAIIDEFDLHMHPRWQRKAMDALSEEFPNTQFIVTAHSPVVVQAAGSDANLIVLRKQERNGRAVIEAVNQPEHAAGWRVEQILESLYGLPPRSAQVNALIEERIALLKKGRLGTAERARLESLEEQIESATEAKGEDASDQFLDTLKTALQQAEQKI